MSKGPGGVTATITCMVVAGFPGIGKTTCFNMYKQRDIFSRVLDFDVKDWGTTNGMDVKDPAAYVNAVVEASKTNELIFVSCDPAVRRKMLEARLFYMAVAPEFPPHIAKAMAGSVPNFVPNPLERVAYMKRFTDNPGYNSKAAQLLDGRGYEDCVMDLFNDPMPHLVAPFLTPEVINIAWIQCDQVTRQGFTPAQVVELAHRTGFDAPMELTAPAGIPNLFGDKGLGPGNPLK